MKQVVQITVRIVFIALLSFYCTKAPKKEQKDDQGVTNKKIGLFDQNSSPQDLTSEGSDPENSSPQDLTSEGSDPENSSPQDLTSEGSDPENSSLQDLTSEGSDPENSSLQDLTSEDSPIQNINKVLVSEVARDAFGKNSCDFLELYNPTSEKIDLSHASIQRGIIEKNSKKLKLMKYDLNGSIEAYGFYLITNEDCSKSFSESGEDVQKNIFSHADLIIKKPSKLIVSKEKDVFLFVKNQEKIESTTNANNECIDPDIIDYIGFGTSSNPPYCMEGGKGKQARKPTRTGSIERKSKIADVSLDLKPSGYSENTGNGYDSGDNSVDFIKHTGKYWGPQNSKSSVERK